MTQLWIWIFFTLERYAHHSSYLDEYGNSWILTELPSHCAVIMLDQRLRGGKRSASVPNSRIVVHYIKKWSFESQELPDALKSWQVNKPLLARSKVVHSFWPTDNLTSNTISRPLFRTAVSSCRWRSSANCRKEKIAETSTISTKPFTTISRFHALSHPLRNVSEHDLGRSFETLTYNEVKDGSTSVPIGEDHSSKNDGHMPQETVTGQSDTV